MPPISNEEVIRAWSAIQNEQDAFGNEGDLARKYLLNPAIFALLGEVAGKRVLDAGCGQGYLCRLLARKGAKVTGLEPAESWYRYAVQREEQERLGITYLQADLSLWQAESSFDAVVCNMVLMDIPDYSAAMENCVRCLKPGGSFIFSLLHPCFEEPGAEWLRRGSVEVREYLSEYTKEQRFGTLFHRPLSSYLNLVIQCGCQLQHVIEPQLSQEAAEQLGNSRDIHVPSFIVIQAIKS
jgi:2-polyprenyl-3-methyl-5-hydroxy-6-metoxy-1,4-benzoquinol methylase